METLLGDDDEPEPQSRTDPWVKEGDPWDSATAGDNPSTSARQQGQSSMAGVTLTGQEPPPMRIIHDVPQHGTEMIQKRSWSLI